MNLKMRSSALLVCLGLACATSAHAGEPGWYILGFAGESSASDNQNQMDDNLADIFESVGLEVVSFDSTIDDSDTGFGLGGGYQLNRNFAFEFTYVDLGSLDYRATATVTDGTDQFEADVGLENSASGPVVSVLGILPIGEQFSVFGRAGLSLMNAKGRARISVEGETESASQSEQKTDPMFGIGAEYNLSKNFAIRLGWDRYLDIGTENVAGSVDADVYYLGVRMGLAWFR
jgi:OOP family OmpA-OmpF porin